jgi:hypothetical protein
VLVVTFGAAGAGPGLVMAAILDVILDVLDVLDVDTRNNPRPPSF